jgi:hypothetical protein
LFVQANTGHAQNNGAVIKVNKKCISHPTRAQYSLPTAATVQAYVSIIQPHILPIFCIFKHKYLFLWTMALSDALLHKALHMGQTRFPQQIVPKHSRLAYIVPFFGAK